MKVDREACVVQIVVALIEAEQHLYKALYMATGGNPCSNDAPPVAHVISDSLSYLVLMKRPLELILSVDFTEERAKRSHE